ncbi:MAG: MATE family efflux transporter [Bacteroidales bacterium]|jgi:putative MATE family efflux protein|nr:MATE family efflux transporter [Bacteroidales bacterium]
MNNDKNAAGEDAQEKKFRKMTTEPVEKLVRHFAVPTIISMLITALYNIVDTFFVSRINSSATGAIGVIFSLMAIIQATGFFFGHGSGNYISRKLGERDVENASKMAAIGFYSAFITGIVITVAGLLMLRPLAYLLGSTDTILPYAEQYMRFILLGAPFFTASFVLNNQLRLQGNAYFAMIGISVGAIINCILDPILIFTMKMGVSGAGLATLISQVISLVILMAGVKRSDAIDIKFSQFVPSKEKFTAIWQGGLPSLGRQSLNSISTIMLNQSIKSFGDPAIAALTITLRIFMLLFASTLGFGQGFQPVCGFNFGAGLYGRVKKAYGYSVRVGAIILIFFSIICEIWAPSIIGIFTDEARVLYLGKIALRLGSITFGLQSLIVVTNMLLQNINEYKGATLLAFGRQGLFLIPFVFLWKEMFGIIGIFLALPFSDLCAFILSYILVKRTFAKMKRLNAK